MFLPLGFPCQSFSQAGNRKGFDDERGRLFYEIPRIVAEWPKRARPKLLIFENVPHLLRGEEGAWIGSIQLSLRRAGYWFRKETCWIANVKEWTDIPQDRERLFLVAASRSEFAYNPFNAPSYQNRAIENSTIHEFVNRQIQAGEADYLPQGNTYRTMIEGAMRKGQSSANLYQVRRNYVREKADARCPTLTANMGVGGHNVPFLRDDWGIRRLCVQEVADLQGFNERESELFPPDVLPANRYRLLGNATCPELARLAGNQLIAALEEIQD